MINTWFVRLLCFYFLLSLFFSYVLVILYNFAYIYATFLFSTLHCNRISQLKQNGSQLNFFTFNMLRFYCSIRFYFPSRVSFVSVLFFKHIYFSLLWVDFSRGMACFVMVEKKVEKREYYCILYNDFLTCI